MAAKSHTFHDESEEGYWSLKGQYGGQVPSFAGHLFHIESASCWSWALHWLILMAISVLHRSNGLRIGLLARKIYLLKEVA